MAKKIDPCTLVLFGASGNLSRVKLMPGLFRLDAAGRLPDHMAILSVGRGEVSREEWQADIKGMLDTKFKKGYDAKVFERFIARNHYHANAPNDADAFIKMKATLSDEKIFPQNCQQKQDFLSQKAYNAIRNRQPGRFRAVPRVRLAVSPARSLARPWPA